MVKIILYLVQILVTFLRNNFFFYSSLHYNGCMYFEIERVVDIFK